MVEVPFGSKATAPNLYANRRTEIWCRMANWLAAGGAIPNDRDLVAELATPIYWYDAAGRKVLESKDDTKKRLQGGASPDIADALALTCTSDVHVHDPIQAIAAETKMRQRANAGSNPFAPIRPKSRR